MNGEMLLTKWSTGLSHSGCLQLLFVGRVVLGVGVGSGTMIGPVYLAEMAPAKLRGSLNVIFQLFVSHLELLLLDVQGCLSLHYARVGDEAAQLESTTSVPIWLSCRSPLVSWCLDSSITARSLSTPGESRLAQLVSRLQ